MAADAASAWAALLEQVPRAAFVPDTIWLDDPDDPGFTAVSRHLDPARWEAAVAANTPVITQINLGQEHVDGGENFPSSSSSQPSVVADMVAALDPQSADAAPYDRVISTASVREVVPPAWLDQLRPGGRLVTPPWGTDYGNGALLAAGSPETWRSCGCGVISAACSAGNPARPPS